MSILPPPSRALPAVPSLEQQKKQARELLDAVLARDPEALWHFRTYHPRFAGHEQAVPTEAAPSLQDAQLVLAREYRFASWPKLKAHIDTAATARRTRVFERDVAWEEWRYNHFAIPLSTGSRTVRRAIT